MPDIVCPGFGNIAKRAVAFAGVSVINLQADKILNEVFPLAERDLIAVDEKDLPAQGGGGLNRIHPAEL